MASIWELVAMIHGVRVLAHNTCYQKVTINIVLIGIIRADSSLPKRTLYYVLFKK